MLKEQNRLLTQVRCGKMGLGLEAQQALTACLPARPPAQEVTDKSERITQLEQEKSALIKQLFEARALSQQDAGPLDSTFI